MHLIDRTSVMMSCLRCFHFVSFDNPSQKLRIIKEWSIQILLLSRWHYLSSGKCTMFTSSVAVVVALFLNHIALDCVQELLWIMNILWLNRNYCPWITYLHKKYMPSTFKVLHLANQILITILINMDGWGLQCIIFKVGTQSILI